jgi:hypothetical protein
MAELDEIWYKQSPHIAGSVIAIFILKKSCKTMSENLLIFVHFSPDRLS